MAAYYPHLSFRHAKMQRDKLNEALVGEILERLFSDRNFKMRLGYGTYFFGFHARFSADFYVHTATIARPKF